MIIPFEGSVFDCPCDILAHQANCFNRMASGVAKEVARRYPDAVVADNRTQPGDKCKLGSFTIGYGADGKHIANLYGQYRYGTDSQKTDYDALRKAFTELKEDYATIFPPINIAIPYKIGCGLAGGDWKVVDAMLQELFGEDENFILYICRRKEDV